MNCVQVASNMWPGERKFNLLPGNKLNLEDFGKGAELYELVTSVGGIVEVKPLSHVFVKVPTSPSEPGVKRSSTVKPRSNRTTIKQNKPSAQNKAFVRKLRTDHSPTCSPRTSPRSRIATEGRTSFKASDIYARAFKKLSNQNWQTVLEGLQELQGVVTTDSDIVTQKATTIIPLLCRLTNHNNKTVSRTSMVCLSELYQTSAANLQHQLKEVIPALIRKTADKTKMLSNEADNSFAMIISSVDSSGLKEIITQLLRFSKEAKSKFEVERATYHLGLTIDKTKYSLIKDPSTDTPIFNLLIEVTDLMGGKHENTRKEARRILTMLAQEASSQGSMTKFKNMLERNISSKQIDKVMELIKKIDSADENYYEYFPDLKPQTTQKLAQKSAPKPKPKKACSRSPYTKPSTNTPKMKSRRKNLDGKTKSKVMEGVEAMYTASEDLTINGRPEDVFKEAQAAINAGPDNWKAAFEALNNMRYLTIHHKDLLKPQINSLTRSLMVQASNLRSSIVKNALMCLQEFFYQFKKLMDGTLHLTVTPLVRRATDNNEFLQLSGIECCNALVESCTPPRVVKELMIIARRDKATTMKEKAVYFACSAVKRLGEDIYEEKNRSSLEDVISTIAPLLYDRSQATRDTTSDLSQIITDYAISSGEIDNFKRIVQIKVPNKFSTKLEVLLNKKLSGEITSSQTKASKKRISSKKKKNVPKKKAQIPKRQAKGKKKQKEETFDRDDILSRMMESFKTEVADDITF